jgi:hypothetical protein
LLYSTKLKKGLPEKCCNPGTLINTIALFEAAPKDEEKEHSKGFIFSHASRKGRKHAGKKWCKY